MTDAYQFPSYEKEVGKMLSMFGGQKLKLARHVWA